MAIFSSILPDLHGYILRSEFVHLKLVRLTGTGAYGAVYLAHDLSSPDNEPRVYAVKCMLKFEPTTEYAALQAREIGFLQSLVHHPHITKLRHVIEEQYYVYLVMDYYDGGDLFSAIIDRQSFAKNDSKVKDAFLQLLDAVQACHDCGIFHRDLKPENILCSCDDTRLYLSDFGLATQTTVSDSFGCGSSFYMSPECIGSAAHFRPYSTREADVWSLGVIFTNMLTARNPWRIASVSHDEGYSMFLTEGPSFLRRLLPISNEAVAILTRVFDPNPVTRISIPELRNWIAAAGSLFPPECTSEALHCTPQNYVKVSECELDVALTEVTLELPGSDNSSSTAFDYDSSMTQTPSVGCTHSSFINEACLVFDKMDAEFELALQFKLPEDIISSNPDTALVAGKQDETKLTAKGRANLKRHAMREARFKRAACRIMGAFHKLGGRA